MKYELRGHQRSHKGTFLFKNLLYMYIFISNLILSKLYMNANIIKTHIFHELKYDLKVH